MTSSWVFIRLLRIYLLAKESPASQRISLLHGAKAQNILNNLVTINFSRKTLYHVLSMFNLLIYVINMYCLLSAAQNKSRYELLLRGRTDLGVYDAKAMAGKQSKHTQSTIDFLLSHLVCTWGPPVWRHVEMLSTPPVTSYCLHGDRLAPAYERPDLHPKSVARKKRKECRP